MTDAEMWMHRDKLRSTASQVTMWCGIIALHQEDGIGKDRLNKLTQGIMEAENAAALQIVELGMAEASRRLQREMRGICEISFHVPYVKRPKKHQELKDQMEKDAAATFGWLVLAKAMHKTYGYGKIALPACTRIHRKITVSLLSGMRKMKAGPTKSCASALRGPCKRRLWSCRTTTES